ncbi:hypothetical protein [Streptomyces sp. NPDC047028]
MDALAPRGGRKTVRGRFAHMPGAASVAVVALTVPLVLLEHDHQ